MDIRRNIEDENLGAIMQEIHISNNEAGQRLDKLLHKLLPEAGNSFLYKMLRKKTLH